MSIKSKIEEHYRICHTLKHSYPDGTPMNSLDETGADHSYHQEKKEQAEMLLDRTEPYRKASQTMRDLSEALEDAYLDKEFLVREMQDLHKEIALLRKEKIISIPSSGPWA